MTFPKLPIPFGNHDEVFVARGEPVLTLLATAPRYPIVFQCQHP